MNRKKLFFILPALVVLLFFTACSDDDKPIEIDPPKEAKSLLILSEGSFQGNNSTLARYVPEEQLLEKNYFLRVNNRGLGDTGNSMLLYGSKLYIVMNVSGTIEVVEAATGKSIRQLPMKTGEGKTGQSKQPRQMAAYDGNVYVTSFDDTVTCIDTVTLEPTATITVGMDPDGIVISNNKMYVANSGGLNYSGGYNNTLSIIDMASFTEEKVLEVGVNPTHLGSDSRGNIYIAALGNYSDIPGVFQKLSPDTDKVILIDEVSTPGKFVISDNKAYIIQGSYGNPYSVMVYDCLNEKVLTENFVTDGTEIDVIHSIAIDAIKGDLFVMESDYTTPGTVYCFNKDGRLQYKIPAIGLNPTAIVIP